MDVNYDYSAAFKGISVKLKKRFLRKPNVSDAIEEYSALSKQLESEECYSLAGYCLQQVAKCYHKAAQKVSIAGYPIFELTLKVAKFLVCFLQGNSSPRIFKN